MIIPSQEEIIIWCKILAGVGSVGTALGIPLFRYIIVPYIFKPIDDFVNAIINDYKQLRSVANTATMVHEIITKELQTNGGSSIKDALKRIENKIMVLDSKHRAVLSLENEPVWESDAEGFCIWANHSYLKMTGFDIGFLKNNGWISIINEKDRERVKKEWNEAVLDKRIFSCEYMINRHDKTSIKVWAVSYPILSIHDNSVTGYVGRLSFCESSAK